ncbi:putative cell surface protein [Candidatus Nanobsidianus stetteri]|uniref:Putative cell surface protein n=1 Tax=Nanobsidianus stetteri TaxID=1294122 RepID=R1GAE4_NANST|nr:putative cell surface protein [Candidatus Nanobsidianus stetteri]
MEKGYKGRNPYRYFMMKGKTLAALGALGILGVAAYSQGAPTIGQLAQSMKSQPTSWTVVVGANANAADVVGASNIIAALETFTSVPTNSTLNTSNLQVQIQGTIPVIQNSYPFYYPSEPLYLGNALNKVVQTIQVGSGSFTTNYNGQQTTYQYNAYVYPQGSFSLQYVQPSPGQSAPVVALASNTPTASPIALTITFSPALNLTQLSQSPQAIQIFNTTYYLVPSSNGNYINFVPAAEVVTLNVNQSVTFNGVNITLQGVAAQYSAGSTTSTGVPAAILNVNGQTITVQVGAQYYIDGVNILVVNVYGPLSSIVTTTQQGAVELVLGTSGYQLPISPTPANVLTSTNQVLNNVQVQMQYTTPNLIQSIAFTFPQLPEIGNSGYYGVVNGQTYTLPLFNYELTFPQVQIPASNSDLIQIQASLTSSGATQFTISYPDALSGKTYTVTIFNNQSNNTLQAFQQGYVNISSTLYPYYVGVVTYQQGGNVTNLTLTAGQYFEVYNPTTQTVEIFQVQSITTGANGVPQAMLEDVISGQTFTITQGNPLVVDNGVSLNPVAINTTATTPYINLTTTGSYNQNELILTAKGPSPQSTPVIVLSGLNTNSTNVSIAEVYPGYTISSDAINLTLSASAGIANLTSSLGFVSGSVSSGATTTAYYLDAAGTYAQLVSSTNSQSLSLYIPLTPVQYPLALAPVGSQAQQEVVNVGVGQTIPGTQLTVTGVTGSASSMSYSQPTALIGKVILDSQVTPSMSNLIVVGGPAVNLLAANAVIQYVSDMNATLGQELQAYANNQSGYVYGSELQPVLQQLGINFGPGMALIMSSTLYPNTLVIFGWSGSDTTQATQLFANYLVNGVDSNVFNNATVVEVNDQQTVNGYPAATQVQ